MSSFFGTPYRYADGCHDTCTSCITCHIIAHRHNIGVRLLVSFMYYMSLSVSSRYIFVFFFAVRF